MTHDQIIATATATATETMLADILRNGLDLDHAISEGWTGYTLTEADEEYLRGEHDDSPEGLPLADEDEQEALERAVEEALSERLTALYIRHATARALDEEVDTATRIVACTYLYDADELRGSEVEERAIETIGAIASVEVESLEEGECLAWDEDALSRLVDTYPEHPERHRLTDRDYLAARIDGEIDDGVVNGAVIGADDESRGIAVISWWAHGVPYAEAIALALTDSETCLTRMNVRSEGQ